MKSALFALSLALSVTSYADIPSGIPTKAPRPHAADDTRKAELPPASLPEPYDADAPVGNTSALPAKSHKAPLPAASEPQAYDGGLMGGETSPVSKIEGASLVCEKDGGLFAFALDHGKERVWQGSSESEEALELAVKKADHPKCPGCHDLTAELKLGGESQEFEFKLRALGAAQAMSPELTVSAKLEDGASEEIMKLSCHKAGAAK